MESEIIKLVPPLVIGIIGIVVTMFSKRLGSHAYQLQIKYSTEKLLQRWYLFIGLLSLVISIVVFSFLLND